MLLASMVFLVAVRAGAQVQEGRMDEILHADRGRTSEFANKSFAASPSVGGKRAEVHAFTGGRTAVLRSGDGAFQTRNFSDRDAFRTQNFDTRADRASRSDAFAQKDRGFATKALAVQEASAANKSVPSLHPYLRADKNIVIRGKRQGDLDDLYNQKELTIDQVREILNKPGGGRDAPAINVGSSPTLHTQPVTARVSQ